MAEILEDKAKPPQHPEEWKRGIYACGERRDHKVRVHRAHWPPKAKPGQVDPPHVSGLCERCGATLLVYDPPDRSVTVVLYGDPADVQGRVEDEAGAVLAEDEAAGGVIEDEPPRPRGRR